MITNNARFISIGIVLLLVLGALAGPTSAQDPDAELLLAEPGPHGVGVTTMTFVDDSREDRELVTEIWYPATITEGEEMPEEGWRDAAPDDSDGPTGAP